MAAPTTNNLGDAVASPQPLTSRAAYRAVLGVFVAFFGASVVGAVLYMVGHGPPVDGRANWSVFGPSAIGLMARAGLAVAVALLVANRYGLSRADLGLTLRRDDGGRVQKWAEVRLAALALLSLNVGSRVIAATASGRGLHAGPHNAANLVYDLAHSIEAGVMEEVVVLGFLIAMLRLAGRSTREIAVVAVLLRVSYHLYYGAGAIGIALWAGLFVWLFWEKHSLLPLIAVHVWWDVSISIARYWGGMVGVRALVTLALYGVAVTSYFVERSRQPLPQPAAVTHPPGWYPDPQAPGRLRRWDGTAWTADTTVRI